MLQENIHKGVLPRVQNRVCPNPHHAALPPHPPPPRGPPCNHGEACPRPPCFLPCPRPPQRLHRLRCSPSPAMRRYHATMRRREHALLLSQDHDLRRLLLLPDRFRPPPSLLLLLLSLTNHPETSCQDLVRTTPSCSDPSFGLFTWTSPVWGDYWFCCRPGELGYLTAGTGRGREACGSPPLGVPTSLLASPVGTLRACIWPG